MYVGKVLSQKVIDILGFNISLNMINLQNTFNVLRKLSFRYIYLHINTSLRFSR